MEENLIYLLTQWLKDKHPLQEFPYTLLGENVSSYKDFLEIYSSQVVYSAFEINLSLFDDFSSVLNVSKEDLVKKNCALLFASVLPYVVSNQNKTDQRFKFNSLKMASAKNRYKFLQEILVNPSVSIEKELGTIVEYLIQASYDPNEWFPKEVVVVPQTPGTFEAPAIIATVESISTLFFQVSNQPVI